MENFSLNSKLSKDKYYYGSSVTHVKLKIYGKFSEGF